MNNFLSRLALPSWVLPGTIEENCAFINKNFYSTVKANGLEERFFLKKTVAKTTFLEIGLLFFSISDALSNNGNGLVPILADMPFTFHAHLPTDLPWNRPEDAAARQSAEVCLALMDAAQYLGTRRAVLHPPAWLAEGLTPGAAPGRPAEDFAARSGREGRARQAGRQLEIFVARWEKAGRDPADILLENIPKAPLWPLREYIERLGCGLCLDLGHALQSLGIGGDAPGQASAGGPGPAITGELAACVPRHFFDAGQLASRPEGNAPGSQACLGSPTCLGSQASAASPEHAASPEYPGLAEYAEWAFKRCGMLHACAVDKDGRHQSLAVLQGDALRFARAFCRRVPPNATLMLELFNWAEIVESLPLLAEWVAPEEAPA